MDGKFHYFGTAVYDANVEKIIAELPLTPILKDRKLVQDKVDVKDLEYHVVPTLNVIQGDYVVTPVHNDLARIIGYHGENLPFATQDGNLSVMYKGKEIMFRTSKK